MPDRNSSTLVDLHPIQQAGDGRQDGVGMAFLLGEKRTTQVINLSQKELANRRWMSECLDFGALAQRPHWSCISRNSGACTPSISLSTLGHLKLPAREEPLSSNLTKSHLGTRPTRNC